MPPSAGAVQLRLDAVDARVCSAIGNRDLLRGRKVGFFCSVRCPGRLILRAYEAAERLRDARATVVGGFHAPMEQECLRILLRGAGPVVVCPARGIDGLRLPPDWKGPLAADRMLVLSPFPQGQRRVTRELAERRNAFVAEVADALLVVYASPGGATERLCRRALGGGKPVFTFPDPENEGLFEIGASAAPEDWGDWTAEDFAAESAAGTLL